MSNPLRTVGAQARSATGWIAVQLGLFLLLGLLLANLARAVDVYTGVGPSDAGISRGAAFVGAILLVGALATWLQAGGYERLGADRSGLGEFVALGLVGLPFSLLPAVAAVSVLVGTVPAARSLYQLGCALVAAWLGLYGGLDRLDLDADLFSWAPIYVLAGALLLGVVEALFAVSTVDESLPGWLRSDAVLAVVLFAGQLLALLLGALHVRRGWWDPSPTSDDRFR